MISKIVEFCLRKRLFVLMVALAVAIVGAIAFKQLPIEAYPDIADTMVQVITQWDGHAAEEVERLITVPTEIEMNGVPHHTALRSISLFGLSVVTLLFDEKTPAFTARQYVLERLNQVKFPNGVQPSLNPMTSPVGQVMFFYLDSKSRSPMELKELEDWEIEKHFRAVPGVADVSSFGGTVKQYQVLLDPLQLANYGLTTSNIVQALGANNQNSGGGFINRGDQAFNIRGVGNADNIPDIKNIIIQQKQGTPIRIGNVGEVVIGPQPRLGNISMSQKLADGSVDERDDIVEGIVASRVGEQDETVLKAVHEEIKELNSHVLPNDVKIRPYLDRLDLIGLTTATVEENLTTGMLLVVLVLLFFLGNLRSALIVAVTIPMSLLIASILLDVREIPANLLSLGALDFGMIVDGAVVMVENIFRHKQERQARKKRGEEVEEGMIALILAAAKEVERPIVYAIAIIILAYLPIFTLQRIEGRLFAPMAWTVAFALLGALILSITVIPVLCWYFLRGDVHEWHNPVMEWIKRHYRTSLEWALAHRNVVVGFSMLSFLATFSLAYFGVGSEFLPHLDEGSIWVRGTLPPSASYELARSVVKKARAVFIGYDEVPRTVCQIGRPDDGTDATGFFNTECFVDLKPRKQWRKEFPTKEDLIASMNAKLSLVPGVIWNFSQPISDNVEEMVSGIKGALVVKIYGEDLGVLATTAKALKEELAKVRGVEDLGIFDELGQPNVNIVIDRDKISRHGLNMSDVQDVIETAVGGKAASQIVEGEKRFDLVVRYQPRFRDTVDRIRQILVSAPDGYRVPLGELADIRIQDGASLIYRENNSRYIAVKFSVRGRDLGSTIDEAQRLVRRKVLLPPGYHVSWVGEFESARRAQARLAVIIPLTALGIFFVLYIVFQSVKWSALVMMCLLTSPVGGILALWLTGTNFSVSSGIGFLALFGVSIQTGMILVSYINQLRKRGVETRQAVLEGAILRVRPILMTALVATFGLLPAAFSHGIGSDSQRPLAIVVVGGLITDLILGFYLLPTLYLWWAKAGDKLEG